MHESNKTAKSVLAVTTDAAMRETWRLVAGDRALMATPRPALLRSDHAESPVSPLRAILVYLRQPNVPVPSVYGPSADENGFA